MIDISFKSPEIKIIGNYETSRKREEIADGLNEFIQSQYGIDVINTCKENNCSEQHIILLPEIVKLFILPALFNRSRSEHNKYNNIDYVCDENLYIMIPEYIENKGLKCVFGSDLARIKYEYRNIFQKSNKRYLTEAAVKAEKSACDLVDNWRKNSAKPDNPLNSLSFLEYIDNEIRNINKNTENIPLLHQNIKNILNKIPEIIYTVNNLAQNKLNLLYKLDYDLIKCDEDLKYDYMLLIFCIQIAIKKINRDSIFTTNNPAILISNEQRSIQGLFRNQFIKKIKGNNIL